MTEFCACAIVGHLWIVPEANSVSTRADFSSGLQKLRSGCAAQPADVLAVLSAGAYCMSMSSTYNSRGRAAEVLIADGKAHLVAEPETVGAIYARERLL